MFYFISFTISHKYLFMGGRRAQNRTQYIKLEASTISQNYSRILLYAECSGYVFTVWIKIYSITKCIQYFISQNTSTSYYLIVTCTYCSVSTDKTYNLGLGISTRKVLKLTLCGTVSLLPVVDEGELFPDVLLDGRRGRRNELKSQARVVIVEK